MASNQNPFARVMGNPFALMMDQMNSAWDPSHKAAHEILRMNPDKFEITLDDRDRALINAPPMEDVAFNGQCCITDLVYAEPGAPLGRCGKVAWHENNDDKCRAMLADAGQVVYEKKARTVVAKPPELQNSINIKVRLQAKPSAEFELGSMTANGSAPGDIRIFKGPEVMNQGSLLTPAFGKPCDGMIIRNAVASSVSLHGTKLDKVWDLLLMNSPQYEIPWLLCAMKEVDEPGGRVVSRVCTVNGVWGARALVGGVVPWADNPQPKLSKTIANLLDVVEAICSEQRYKASGSGGRFAVGDLETAMGRV